MDTVSHAILDVMFAKQALTIALNIVHPRPFQWPYVTQSVIDALHHAGVVQESVPLIPFSEWFERLEQRSKGADADEIADIVSWMLAQAHMLAHAPFQPAIKLLDFFRGMASVDEGVRQSGHTDVEVGSATLSTAKSQAASKAMAEVEPIRGEDAQLWANYWISKGFFR